MTATIKAFRLKMDWMEMPSECFETLTFGEIKIGQKFICLPQPGDNAGHGGLMGAHYIYTKTHLITKVIPSLPNDIPHGKAVDGRGISSLFPYSMPIILVK